MNSIVQTKQSFKIQEEKNTNKINEKINESEKENTKFIFLYNWHHKITKSRESLNDLDSIFFY